MKTSACALKLAIVSLTVLPLLVAGNVSAEGAICPKPWVCEKMALDIPVTKLSLRLGTFGALWVPSIELSRETIRSGYYPERGTFRGNVLYFEGLGDSMVNHEPLFKKMSAAGFRVISFDYMGQGGSSGKMDRTRLEVIPFLGNAAWKKYARDVSEFPKKTIIGWSTGGLAAYLSAGKGNADRIILIAPGIAPHMLVGGGLLSWPPNEITMESLTSAKYGPGVDNPHVDPIRPNSPLKVAHFALDLFSAAKAARSMSIPPSVPGLVLLSGKNDTYVDAKRTRAVLAVRAPHFKIVEYDGALHEIDNERTEIQNSAIDDIVEFLGK